MQAKGDKQVTKRTKIKEKRDLKDENNENC